MNKMLLIGAGGGVGAIARYVLAGWCQRFSAGLFPIGTLAVNCLGCLAIGFLGMALTGPLLIREEYRVALLVGVLGGFTTFSTYGRETYVLVADGQLKLAALNLILSNGIGLVGVWLGHRAAERYFGV